VTLSGPLFSATNNSSFDTTSLGFPGSLACCNGFNIGQGARLESTNPSADPHPPALIQLTNSLFNAGPDAQSGGNFFSVRDVGALSGESNPLVSPSSVILERPLLHATDSTITALFNLLQVVRSSLSSNTQDPLIKFDGNPGSTLTLGGENPLSDSPAIGDVVSITGSPSPLPLPNVSLAGALLSTTDTNITATGRLLSISNGGQLISTTTDSLIKLTGGTHAFGSGTGSGAGSLLDLRGVNTDSVTGLGTDTVLQTGGTIFEADPTTINLSGSGNAIRVDTALLAASAPIVKLINSTLNTSSTGDAVTGAMRLFQSSVTSLGPVFGLDNSILNVQSGPLLSLTGGSSLTVNGDFASLTNGSRITVVNGPLIRVSGSSTGPTSVPSTLTVTGGLVNFGGTGGNQVIVNNSILPTGSPMSGLPVNVGGGGSSISIGPTPIKNPGLGSVTINGTPAGAGPFTGSLIQATGGGKVTITAP
jgi:hypothetical protein